MKNKTIKIENSDGSTLEVELVTYLISDDQKTCYLVYSKGEKSGNENDEIIYISKVNPNNGSLVLEEIKDDSEWSNVQLLLKRIANS